MLVKIDAVLDDMQKLATSPDAMDSPGRNISG